MLRIGSTQEGKKAQSNCAVLPMRDVIPQVEENTRNLLPWNAAAKFKTHLQFQMARAIE